MPLKKPELKIDPQNPFEHDKLKRRESAVILTELFKSVDEPLVLCINSPWGTGKTTFVKMWKEYLSNDQNNFHCLYFNAWENDFSSDPLISFIGEIQAEIVASLDEGDSKAKEYFEKAKKIGGSLVKKSIPALIKGVTYGALDVGEVYEQLTADVLQKLVQEEIESYEKSKNTLQEFKKNLTGFMAELSKADDSKGKPLIFFIDELDRCRPTYAVELLERIKHLFNVPGVIFVLVLDKEQLAHSIRSLYGVGMNVDGYLRRFIDLEYQLPRASIEDFCIYLFDEFKFKDFFSKRRNRAYEGESELLFNAFIGIAQAFKLSLREVEQCFTRVKLVFDTTPENRPIYPTLLAFLILLRNSNLDLYNRFTSGSASSDEVLEFIGKQSRGISFWNSSEGQAVKAYILGAFCNHRELQNLISHYQQLEKEDSLSGSDNKKLSRILEFLQHFDRMSHYDMGKYLAKKIEMLEHFVIESNQPVDPPLPKPPST